MFKKKDKLKLIFGKGEIEELDSQIVKALKIIDGCSIKDFQRETAKVRKIEKLGFEVVKSSGIAFLGGNQVIKCALITSVPPKESHRVPTLIYAYENIKNWSWNYAVLIQPRIKPLTSNKEISAKFDDLWNDVHHGNVGIYKRRQVLHDW